MSKTPYTQNDADESPDWARPDWARPWLESVRESARAIERERRAQQIRRIRAERIPSGSSAAVRGGGGADRTSASDAFIEGEAALHGGPGSYLSEHFDRISEFDRVMADLRSGTADEINAGTYVAECRYKMDLDARQTARELGLSMATVHRRVCTLIDYMDHLGPEQFHVTA